MVVHGSDMVEYELESYDQNVEISDASTMNQRAPPLPAQRVLTVH